MRSKHKSTWRVYLLVAIVISVTTVAIDQWGWFKRFDNLVYDQLIMADSRPAADNIVIIAIDEKSLEQLGRWPWPRELHTRLMQQLIAVDDAIVGIDIIFSEPYESPQVDHQLAQAIHDHGRVVLPVVPVSGYKAGTISERHPIPLLEAAAARIGNVDAELDEDGISRSIYLLGGLGAPIWPSFPLAMLSLKETDIEDHLPGTRNKGSNSSRQGEWVRDYLVRVPFTGPPGNYQHLSYIDVLEGRVAPADLAGKYLLIGVTASGIGDRMPTPTTGHNYQMPGVEYMANVLDALLADSMITIIGNPYRMALVFLLVLLPLLIYPVLTVRLSLLVWLSATLLVLGSSAALLQWQLWLPPAAALISLMITFPVWVWSRLRKSSMRVNEVEQNRSAAMDAVDHGVIILDTDFRIEHMNSLAEQMTSCKLENVANQKLGTVLPGMEVKRDSATSDTEVRHQDISLLPKEIELVEEGGSLNRVYVRINPFSDRWGGSRGYVLNLALDPSSLSSRNSVGAEANYDARTGLYDRTYISSHIREMMTDVTADGEFYVLNIDIDNLALITDSGISASTDQLLLEFVQRLKTINHEDNELARVGSDQLVLLTKTDDLVAVELFAAEIIRQTTQPVYLDGSPVMLSVNIGISHYPTDGHDAETLLKHASFAIRQNESMARTRYKFYSRKDHEISLLDHGIEQGLRKSLDEDALQLFYQPKISLQTGEVVGFEALLRWIGKDGKFMSTEKVITIAEQSELIHELGSWVVNTACQQMEQWQQEDLPFGCLSINLSPADLERAGFLEDTIKVLQKRNIDPARLEFEITEHSVLKETDLSAKVLESFRDVGVNLTIDDFGTGYSTFNYLKAIPVNTIKIDKSFVEYMADIEDDAFIVMTMISMAHGLGIYVVAEGIETPVQARMLKQQGCDAIQGYLVSRPIPADEVANWLNDNCQHREDKYYLKDYSAW